MSSKSQQMVQKGFTIIEVLIVLAIAATILLLVFLAVPALQRNSRNTQRKTDVSSLLAAVTESTSNSAGVLPTTSGTFVTAFPNAQPKLSYYTTPANVTYKYQAGATVVADPGNPDKVVVANYAKCNATNSASVTTNATARTIVVMYDVEGSNGLIPQCQESGA